jgi:hypothetical protein
MPHGLELLLFVLLAGTLGIIPAVFMALWIADKVATRRALRASLPVDAVVLSKRVIERTDADEFTHYYPHVEYNFSVNGTEYTSSTIWSGGVSEFEMSIKQVDKFLEEFPVGQTVQAFYDPDDPEKSFLIRKHPVWGRWISNLIVWFMFLMYFGVVWASGLLLSVMGVMVLTLICIAGWLLWQNRHVTEDKSDG